jgi:hypothetical protein
MHVAAVPIWHVPAVLFVVTQRAGARHVGPFALSHAAPSAAGAAQMPAVWPIAIVQKPPAAHPTSAPLTTPHGWPAAASVNVAHIFVVASQ